MIGPPTPRTAQVLGGRSSVISSVLASSRGPARRVTTALEPTASGASPSWRADTTPPCQSGKREKSVTYEKTSSGRRDISMLSTISAMSPPILTISMASVSSLLQLLQVKPGKALGVGEDVDLDDPPARDGEAEDRDRPATRG